MDGRVTGAEYARIRDLARGEDKQATIDALVAELENIANEMRPLAARKSTRYAGLHWAIESAERAIRNARGLNQ